MKTYLKDLLQSSGVVCKDNIEIYGLEFDSRKIRKGDLFIAVTGHEMDGHQFIERAVESGAAAIIGEKDLNRELTVPYYRVHNTREVLFELANKFYCKPHDKHKLIGITGTNGKTTTAYLLHHILTCNERTTSLFGTAGYILNGRFNESNLTTPDCVTLHKMLYESNDEFVIMEVSSHGLDQQRVSGSMFDYAIFTNLSHEHLDYHSDLEEYYETKKKIFRCLKKDGKGVVGTYNYWGKRLYEELAEELIPTIPFADKGEDDEKNICIKTMQPGPKASMTLKDNGKEFKVRMKMPGKHNIMNAFGSYVCAREIGLQPEQIIDAIESFEGAPGRFDVVDLPMGAKAIVDYAHTPDGLYHALTTAKQCVSGGIYHIFGFRGKRDESKRKEMIEISQKYSDRVILTLDDLNGVDRKVMIEELHKLSKTYSNVEVIEDRTAAIIHVLGKLNEGDAAIITGKGNERYKESFKLNSSSDAETVQKFILMK